MGVRTSPSRASSSPSVRGTGTGRPFSCPLWGSRDLGFDFCLVVDRFRFGIDPDLWV